MSSQSSQISATAPLQTAALGGDAPGMTSASAGTMLSGQMAVQLPQVSAASSAAQTVAQSVASVASESIPDAAPAGVSLSTSTTPPVQFNEAQQALLKMIAMLASVSSGAPSAMGAVPMPGAGPRVAHESKSKEIAPLQKPATAELAKAEAIHNHVIANFKTDSSFMTFALGTFVDANEVTAHAFLLKLKEWEGTLTPEQKAICEFTAQLIKEQLSEVINNGVPTYLAKLKAQEAAISKKCFNITADNLITLAIRFGIRGLIADATNMFKEQVPAYLPWRIANNEMLIAKNAFAVKLNDFTKEEIPVLKLAFSSGDIDVIKAQTSEFKKTSQEALKPIFAILEKYSKNETMKREFLTMMKEIISPEERSSGAASSSSSSKVAAAGLD